MPELVLPDLKYKESYLQALKEYQEDKENELRLKTYKGIDLEEIRNNFETHISHIKNEALGIGLPTGYVSHTVYWLVEGSEYLGRVDIRHKLNEALEKEGGHIGYDVRPSQRKKGYGTLALKLAVQKAHELGIKDILITCDVDNVGSNKIIQTNGGIFANAEYIVESKPSKNRYWIRN